MSDIREACGAHQPAECVERDAIASEARQEIEAVLSAFRQWLLEAERWRDIAVELPEASPNDEAPVDLHTVLAEWTALKTEFNLSTRGSRASGERLEQALGEFHRGIDAIGRETQQALEPLVRERDRLRDGAAAKLDATEQHWITVLLDVREALARGVQASRQARQRLGWRGTFLPRGLFGGLLEGYGASLRRVDAALETNGVVPIECDGRPVDPARMHVVDVVHRDGVANGEVVEVVRPGYVRGDRVIRHAEVRAAVVKSSGSAEGNKTDDPSTTID